ncbi:EAL domain-containing protein [Propionivibrio limicola]|uniref:EAL domain-containing protein n=1 Tax=Propionivibrio limicola TaxID=167645 RepID=UPI001291C2B7|nr:EAL domain-containing protein [Propionivibrio limicola]
MRKLFRPFRLAGHCIFLAFAVLPLLAVPAAASAGHGREIIVGVHENEPKIFMGPNGQPSGILGDLLVEMARQEGWKLKPVACIWQDCLTALQSGTIDLLPDVAFSEERSRQLGFHERAALNSWSRLYHGDSAQINSMLDLQGKRVAVMEGSIQQTYLDEVLRGFGVQAVLVPVASIPEGFRRVAAGELDVAVANRFVGDLQAPRHHLLETPVIFQPTQLYYATASGRNVDLRQAIDEHLEKWQAQPDSVYSRVLERWMGAAPPRPFPRAVWWIGAGLLFLFLVTLKAVAFLRRQVARKTAQLRENENRLNTILDSVDAHIFIKDSDFRYQYVNRGVCDLFACTRTAIIGREDKDFFDADTAANMREDDRLVLQQGKRIEVKETKRTLDGRSEKNYLTVKQPLLGDDGEIQGLCGVSTDITRLAEAEAAIHELAFYDPLTGLPNRRLLHDRLQQAMSATTRYAEGGALLFIDLDNFKDLNDTQGHDAGDRLLVQAAGRLHDCVRETDTIARLGGDEFVVMLRGLSAEPDQALLQAERIGRKIWAAMRQPYELVGQSHLSTVSIGIAMFSDQYKSKEDLLKRADLAMYQAKADGRDTLRFFNPDMQAKVAERTGIESALRLALAHSQFVLHYQPQVDSSGRIRGVEALVRWQRPGHGVVPPDSFIPVAESSGLILPLGDWILQTACGQLVAWADDPVACGWHIAVNVSAHQFRQPDFADKVIGILGQTGASPALLKLELTESQLIDDIDSVIYQMERLTEKGVRFSLDDFGTGYSSLSFLKRLPLDQVKIDRSFVRDLLSDPDDASIVKTIIALGQSLQLKVIAEGVETQEQRDTLERIGCFHYQGYLFGRPVNSDSLAASVAA